MYQVLKERRGLDYRERNNATTKLDALLQGHKPSQKHEPALLRKCTLDDGML
eukprot:SAG31_NODE_2237_length_6120_cov_7.767276_1_plen_51_part_10